MSLINYNNDIKIRLNNFKDYKDKTVSGYIQKINAINAIINNTKNIINLEFLKDFNKVNNILSEKIINIGTRKTYFICCQLICSVYEFDNNIIESYKNICSIIGDELDKNQIKQNKTETENNNWIIWSDILKKEQELKLKNDEIKKKDKLNNKDIYDIQKQLIISLYTKLAVRRLEYSNVIIIYDEKLLKKILNEKIINHNYLLINKNNNDMKMYFSSYKTFKSYGIQIFDVLDKELKEDILYWISIKSNKTKFLLQQLNGSRLLENNLTLILNRIFGKKISTSMIRKSYISEQYYNNPDLETKIKLAKELAHDKSTAEKFYKKKL